ncbi:hypothetical protein [Sinosporangium siamense]|uniref:Uncharacterized protein n=1 Tax=Sinosporangium siamense TaxID=1367973 RepID=A0A919RE66_9ACTN|nr:hypothetical protein [Sinosporangium siamense]GII92218.1 hypothetical protein Ssi02_24490 [Sinosporangium siamense]
MIVNNTSEEVAVRWKLDAKPFKTFAPGQGLHLFPTKERCRFAKDEDSLVATTASGQTYTYGPPICAREAFVIGR